MSPALIWSSDWQTCCLWRCFRCNALLREFICKFRYPDSHSRRPGNEIGSSLLTVNVAELTECQSRPQRRIECRADKYHAASLCKNGSTWCSGRKVCWTEGTSVGSPDFPISMRPSPNYFDHLCIYKAVRMCVCMFAYNSGMRGATVSEFSGQL